MFTRGYLNPKFRTHTVHHNGYGLELHIDIDDRTRNNKYTALGKNICCTLLVDSLYGYVGHENLFSVPDVNHDSAPCDCLSCRSLLLLSSKTFFFGI